MTNATSPQMVVVGIDGSRAAIDAAMWAIDEAIDRDVPLRLVHATGMRRTPFAPAEALAPEIEYGETSLRAASSRVAASGKTVKVEAELLWGPVEDALVTESVSASILCVGSVGIGWVAKRVLGATAAAVAEKAHCPVVVVRSRSDVGSGHSSQWIVVDVDERPENEQVVTRALDEAHLRHAPVLAVGTWHSELGELSYDALESRVPMWRERYSDLHIRAVSTGGSLLPQFLAGYRNDVQLAVVSADGHGQLPLIVGPHVRPLLPHGECSVMVVH
jgi:nucleotide-binding universal stress UspA family protein